MGGGGPPSCAPRSSAKRRARWLLALGTLGILALLSGCAGNTTGASNVRAHSATLNGTVHWNSSDSQYSGELYFQYSSNGGASWTDAWHDPYGNPYCPQGQDCHTDLHKDVSGLSPGAHYVYRLCDRANGNNPICWDHNGSSGGTNYDSFTTPSLPPYFGYNVSWTVPGGFTPTYIDDAKNGGANVVRIGIPVGTYYPGSGCDDPSQATFDNNAFLRAAQQGLAVILMVTWCPNTGPTNDGGAWVNTVKTVIDDANASAQQAGIQHLNIVALEVWNEPNDPGQWGNQAADPTAYARQVYEPIKAFLGGYSGLYGAPIITAGLNPLDHGNWVGMNCGYDQNYLCAGTYLSQVLTTLANDGFSTDGVGVHLYGETCTGQSLNGQSLNCATNSTVESEMQAEFNNLGGQTSKPLFVTEFGRRDVDSDENHRATIDVDMLRWLGGRAAAASAYAIGSNSTYDLLDSAGNPKGGQAGAYCQLEYEVGTSGHLC
jgi:hypothetical protein